MSTNYQGLPWKLSGNKQTSLSNNCFDEAFNSNCSLREDFLRQPTISYTVHPNIHPVITQHLISRIYDSGPYGKRLINTYTGDPIFGSPFLSSNRPFPAYSWAAAQGLAYALALKEIFNFDLLETDLTGFTIVDFGGGYGSFARLLLTLNPTLNVIIVDLAQMLKIQSAYLDKTGPYRWRSRTRFVESMDEGFKYVTSLTSRQGFHFHSSYALNECAQSLVEQVLNQVVAISSSFSIVYADPSKSADTAYNSLWGIQGGKAHHLLAKTHIYDTSPIFNDAVISYGKSCKAAHVNKLNSIRFSVSDLGF